MSGSYGSSGSVSLVKQCSTRDNVELFVPGDRWVGSYACSPRLGSDTFRQEIQEFRRIELLIEAITSEDDIIAVVDFDHYDGIGQYRVTAHYESQSTCLSIQFTPTIQAWITDHPVDVHAHQLSGRLRDDLKHIDGQLNLNPHCVCSGQVSDSVSKRGGSCDDWDNTGESWCFVHPSCPEGSRDPQGTSFYRAACGIFPTCSVFSLTRICPIQEVPCSLGFTKFGGRCYKVLNVRRSFENARIACQDEGADLVTIHSPAENAFVFGLLDDADTQRAWLGLQQQRERRGFVWIDDTPASLQSYQNWAENEPSETSEACASITVSGNYPGQWVDGSCSDSLTVVCKKPPPVVNASCECNGQTDEDGRGGFCKEWSQDNLSVPWCYTSPYCPRAIPAPDSDSLFRTACSPSEVPTTTGHESTTSTTSVTDMITSTSSSTKTETPSLSCHEQDPTTYTRDDGKCASCVTEDDCKPNQFLFGQCAELTTPQCIDCDSSCASCDGIDKANCTACAEGHFRSNDGVECLVECPVGQFVDKTVGQCQSCHETCAACSGRGDTSCTKCYSKSNLFLLESTHQCVSDCGDGFFANDTSQLCQKCSLCSPTQFLVASCSKNSDTDCKLLTTCNDDEFESVPPTTTSDRNCTTYSVCSPGNYVSINPSPTSNRICEPCPAGTTATLGDTDTVCTPCDPGTYTAAGHVGKCPPCKPGTADMDKDPGTPCKACPTGQAFSDSFGMTSCTETATCKAGEEEAEAPSASTNRVCTSCPNGKFKHGIGQETRCLNWTTCAPGYEPVEPPPTTTRDRICAKCNTTMGIDAFFKPSVGNFPCRRALVCEPGFEEVVQPTLTSNRKCNVCSQGKFTLGRNDKCKSWSECEAGIYYSVPGTSSSDAQCLPLTDCDQTEYEIVKPTATTDRECRSLRVCDFKNQREYESKAPLKDDDDLFISDRECSPCLEPCPSGEAPLNPCTPFSNAGTSHSL